VFVTSPLANAHPIFFPSVRSRSTSLSWSLSSGSLSPSLELSQTQHSGRKILRLEIECSSPSSSSSLFWSVSPVSFFLFRHNFATNFALLLSKSPALAESASLLPLLLVRSTRPSFRFLEPTSPSGCYLPLSFQPSVSVSPLRREFSPREEDQLSRLQRRLILSLSTSEWKPPFSSP